MGADGTHSLVIYFQNAIASSRKDTLRYEADIENEVRKYCGIT